MQLAILSVCTEEELLEDAPGDANDIGPDGKTAEELLARRARIKRKILAVGKMQRVFQLLRFVQPYMLKTHNTDMLGIQGGSRKCFRA